MCVCVCACTLHMYMYICDDVPERMDDHRGVRHDTQGASCCMLPCKERVDVRFLIPYVESSDVGKTPGTIHGLATAELHLREGDWGRTRGIAVPVIELEVAGQHDVFEGTAPGSTPNGRAEIAADGNDRFVCSCQEEEETKE